MEPVAEQMELPEEYGRPAPGLLEWDTIRRRLGDAPQYWLATTRPDGRPHVVPVDGVWVDDIWYFGGSDRAVHQRNLRHNRHVAAHLADPMAVVVVEGTVERRTPEPEEARGLAESARAKYGYPVGPDDYAAGVWALRPTFVLAWDHGLARATRFVF